MQNVSGTENLIHDLDGTGAKNSFTSSQFFLFLVTAIAAGIIAGFLFSLMKNTQNGDGQTAKSKDIKKTAGIADKKTFKDKAEGVLKEGGIDGEGNFHLERPGGESQNVYLTSTTVDLSLYLDKKIRVWGETFQAEKAGWLMDVGLVELLQ